MSGMVGSGGVAVGDGTWTLSIFVTDLQVERALRVKGDLHIGGVMIRLVDELGKRGRTEKSNGGMRLIASAIHTSGRVGGRVLAWVAVAVMTDLMRYRRSPAGRKAGGANNTIHLSIPACATYIAHATTDKWIKPRQNIIAGFHAAFGTPKTVCIAFQLPRRVHFYLPRRNALRDGAQSGSRANVNTRAHSDAGRRSLCMLALRESQAICSRTTVGRKSNCFVSLAVIKIGRTASSRKYVYVLRQPRKQSFGEQSTAMRIILRARRS